jgi:hypothetical protein
MSSFVEWRKKRPNFDSLIVSLEQRVAAGCSRQFSFAAPFILIPAFFVLRGDSP